MRLPDARIAVVDVGSNSVRLFLCDGIDASGPSGERTTTVVGLRRGAAADGTLAEDALARLDGCLAEYAGPTARFAPDRIVAVGTSAVRDAPNRDRVGAILRDRLGAALTVLDGEQEALCSFAGARLGAPGAGEIMVVDIGGASTELVRGGPQGPAGAVSLQLGAVRQTERHLTSDPPAAGEVAALRGEAGQLVRGALERIGGPAAAMPASRKSSPWPIKARAEAAASIATRAAVTSRGSIMSLLFHLNRAGRGVSFGREVPQSGRGRVRTDFAGSLDRKAASAAGAAVATGARRSGVRHREDVGGYCRHDGPRSARRGVPAAAGSGDDQRAYTCGAFSAIARGTRGGAHGESRCAGECDRHNPCHAELPLLTGCPVVVGFFAASRE